MTALNQKILNILQKTLPTEIVKRGNAFSQIQLIEKSEIKDAWDKIEFEEVFIQPTESQSAKGECYLLDSFNQESDFYLEVKGISSLNQANYSVKELVLDCCAQEIFLTISS